MGDQVGEARAKFLCVVVKPLGDSVCIIPEIRFLAERHGGPADLLLKNRAQRDIYAGLDSVDGLHLLEHWRTPFWFSPEQLRLAAVIGKRKYDRIYFFLETDRRKHKKLERLLRLFRVPRDRMVSGFPEEYKRLLSETGREAGSAWRLSPILHVSSGEREAVRERLRRECGWQGQPLVLIHPGNALTAAGRGGPDLDDPKWWPGGNWRALLGEMARQNPEVVFAFTGTGGERSLLEGLVPDGAAAKRIFNLAGFLSLRELFALQSLAHSAVTCDTGTSHSGLAVGCPTVIIYGQHDPRRLGRCSPKGWGPVATVRGFREPPPAGDGDLARFIRRIRPETVYGAWRGLPARRSTPADADGMVSYYCEGDAAVEVLPIISF